MYLGISQKQKISVFISVSIEEVFKIDVSQARLRTIRTSIRANSSQVTRSGIVL